MIVVVIIFAVLTARVVWVWRHGGLLDLAAADADREAMVAPRKTARELHLEQQAATLATEEALP